MSVEMLKAILDQPIDGLLYDLDLMPEQLKTERDKKLNLTVTTLRYEMDRLEASNEAAKYLVREMVEALTHQLELTAGIMGINGEVKAVNQALAKARKFLGEGGA